MSHEDEGHYRAKHPEGENAHPKAAELIKKHAKEGKINCVRAHAISDELDISPGEVGKTIDLLEIRISRCQLGLFGYGKEKGSIVTPTESVSDEVKAKIMNALKNKKVSCLSLWNIAAETGMSKLEVSAACEALGQKICCCQLGAFG